MTSYEKLFSPLTLCGYPLKNRICVPPLVIYTWADESGRVTDKHVQHYRALTGGGAGLVIQEATSVTRAGRLTRDQLGIWEDGQINGLRRIVEVFHEAHMPAILQLSHAGLLSAGRENQVAPSDYRCFGNDEERVAREMTVEEIHDVEHAFIDAARRAVQAGYDGIELHGCHGYLLSEFLNTRLNRRTDAYNAADRLIWKNIIEGIRAVTPDGFILGVRLGAFEPGLSDGIANAQWLEAMGIDFIDSFVGCDWENDLQTPAGYPFNPSIYGAQCVKQAVHIPVFAVMGIRTGEQAEQILQHTGVDMVVIGRGSLVNHNWGNDVLTGRDVGMCRECAVCMWKVAPEKCPGHLALLRSRSEHIEKNPAAAAQ